MTCFAGPIWASESEPGFSLEFSAPLGCPDRHAFVTAVTSRTRAGEASAERAGFALKVEVDGAAERASGRLSITLADGQESSRTIPTGSCSEVLASMAVISALVLEGHGLDAPPPAPGATEAVSVAERPERERQPRTASPPHAPSETEPAEPASDTRLKLRALLQGSLETGVAPTLSPGIAAGADFTLERANWLAPSALLFGRFVAGGREPTRFGDARFRLLALALAACPARFQPVRATTLRPCLLFDAGQLRSDGRRTLDRATELMPWLGLGAVIRAEARLTNFLAFELQARAAALLHHDRFIFQPGIVAHDVPALTVGVGAGLLLGPP